MIALTRRFRLPLLINCLAASLLLLLTAPLPAQSGTAPGSDWFPFTASNHTGDSVFAMDDWLDKPAGKHGGVRMVDDHFQFEDGTRVKFWGTNLAYAEPAPEHAAGEDTAKRFARYGINAVRLHKFTGAGWAGIGDPNDVTQFDEKGLERMDYFTSKLEEHGIYFGFSHTFNMQVRPGNKDKLLAYDEIQSAARRQYHGPSLITPRMSRIC